MNERMFRAAVATSWAFCLFCVLALHGFAQTNSEILKRKISIDVENESFEVVVRRLIQKEDLAFGLEVSSFDADRMEFFPYPFMLKDASNNTIVDDEWLGYHFPERPYKFINRFTLKFRNTEVQTVIDELVKQMKNYDWELADGVINIVPVKGRDKRLSEFLDLQIGKGFSLQAGDPKTELEPAIMLNMPEVIQFAKSKRLSILCSFVEECPKCSNVFDEDLEVQPMRLRDMLNRITRQKRGAWRVIISESRNPNSPELLELDI
ncbi:MAG: hypothetical protein R2684_07935 [Pyrinomonadaceae bacterium]